MNTTSDHSFDENQRPADSGRGRDVFRLLIWCLACLGVPLLFLSGEPSVVEDDIPVSQKSNRKWNQDAEMIDKEKAIADLRATQPEYIGIGNSMMFTRLGKTSKELSALTGHEFFLITKGGTDAPAWYLILKNIVAASGVRPKAVFLFIRDNELTAPHFGNDKVAPVFVQSLRGEHEPELDRFMQQARSDTDLVGRADHWLGELYSFPESKESMSRRLMDLAMDMGGGGSAIKSQRFALSTRFGLEHLRGDVASDIPVMDDLTLMTSNYEETAESSLLPEIIHVAAECGARLIVFRVKRRPDAETHLPEEPEAMRDYADFLGRWLKDRRAIFFDETYDTSIRLTDYLDGDHIRPERQDWYRSYFWQRTQGLFP